MPTKYTKIFTVVYIPHSSKYVLRNISNPDSSSESFSYLNAGKSKYSKILIGMIVKTFPGVISVPIMFLFVKQMKYFKGNNEFMFPILRSFCEKVERIDCVSFINCALIYKITYITAQNSPKYSAHKTSILFKKHSKNIPFSEMSNMNF